MVTNLIPVREKGPSLPENSRYLPVEKFWLQRVNLPQNGRMDTDTYARKVVSMIQKKNKKPIWFWRGRSASLAWFLYYFVPRSVRLFLVARRGQNAYAPRGAGDRH
jgi:hypothetical protein